MRKDYINVSWLLGNKVARYTREVFIDQVINNPERNAAILAARAETDPKKKKKLKEALPCVCWNVEEFTGDQRCNASAVPGIFFAADYDRKHNPLMGDAREYFEAHVKPLIDPLRIVWVEESVNCGLHIVAQRPQNAGIPQAQQHQADLVGLNHDTSCKDDSRPLILGHKDEIFHADWDAIFGAKELEPYTIDLPEAGGKTEGEASLPIKQEAMDKVRAKEFFGLPLGDIFDAYVGTELIPEGKRNATVFGKSHKLMALGLSTEELVALFKPVTRLTDAELAQACRTQPNYVPADGKLCTELRTVIRQLRQEKGLETSVGLLHCRPIPTNLPPFMKVILSVVPQMWWPAVLILMLPIIGFLSTQVRGTYLDGNKHSTTQWAHAVGTQAGGKSTLINWLANLLMGSIREQDEAARRLEREYSEAVRRAKNADKQPQDPKPVIREIPFTISVAALLKRLDQAKGQHLISICDEVDTVIKTNKAGAWSEKTDIYRNAFDNQTFGQDYLSENSYSGMFPVIYNGLSGGTEESTERFLGKHVNDGLAGRIAITGINEAEGGKMPVIKRLTPKQEAVIRQGIAELQQAEGEVSLPRTLKALSEWLDEKYRLSVETASRAIDIFRRRAAVMAFRAAIDAYILFGHKEKQAVVEYALFIADYVLQQQVARWGFHIESAADASSVTPVANLYQELPEEFSREELVNLRTVHGQGTNVRMIIKRWKDNGMIREVERNRYIKTRQQA